MEIEKNQTQLYLEEIKQLREINTEIKLKLSSINEEAHQLDIQKLNNQITIKNREIELLEKEKNSLKEQLLSYERYFKNVFEKYRTNTESNSLQLNTVIFFLLR